MSNLALAHDAPTHKLVIKLDDGTFRTFYLTVKEAEWIAQNINSVEPNIILSKSIDPQYPSFYPKRGSWMEKMSQSERESRAVRYANDVRSELQYEQEREEHQRREKQSKAVRVWIDENPERFQDFIKAAENKFMSSKGIFHSASVGVKHSLIHFEAMRMVDDLLTHQNASQ